MEMAPEAREVLRALGSNVEEYGRKIASAESSMEDLVNLRDCLMVSVSTITTLLQANPNYNRRW
jgi:hypothetical protein